MPSSKPYHHGDLRNALLEASLALIREEGPDGFTLRELARRAQVSHTAPYRHFRGKDDVLAAIAEEGFQHLTTLLRSAASKKPEPLRRLEDVGLAYVEFALDQPEHFRVMFAVPVDRDRHPGMKKAAEEYFQALLEVVMGAWRSGLMPGLEPITAARIAWAQVHGVAELVVRRQFGFQRKAEILAFTRIAAEAVLSGLMNMGRTRAGG